jgi:hypothetical protein
LSQFLAAAAGLLRPAALEIIKANWDVFKRGEAAWT